MARPTIVAIDGPAGSGKSSICSLVSEKLGWTYVNTGALYRAVGLIADEKGVDLDDDRGVAAIVTLIAPDLGWDAAGSKLWYKNRDLTADLLSVQAGNAASRVAKLATVRKNLLPVQRELTLKAPKGALVDGRDIGTVVFPEADLKVFLTATLEERARRRLLQLQEAGKIDSRLSDAKAEELNAELRRDIEKRDRQDSGRDHAPLAQAEDALPLDTSTMGIDAVVDAVIELIKQRKLL